MNGLTMLIFYCQLFDVLSYFFISIYYQTSVKSLDAIMYHSERHTVWTGSDMRKIVILDQ